MKKGNIDWKYFFYLRWLSYLTPWTFNHYSWFRKWQGGDWYCIRPHGLSHLIPSGLWIKNSLPEGSTASALFTLIKEEHYG